MKKVLFLLILTMQALWAQDAFERGNQAYSKEKYQDAAAAYEQLLASGQYSAAVYFNLGNSYYKLHRIAPAIYNYEKALQLSPHDAEIATNLDFARKMAIDDIKVIPKVGFKKMLTDVTSHYHYDTWAWIAVAMAFLCLLCFAGYYFAGTAVVKRIFFISMFLALLAMAASLFSAGFEKDRSTSERPAIVFADTASVKSEPKPSAPDTFLLHEGAKVYVLESIANWKKIQLTDETTGWIESESIKELN